MSGDLVELARFLSSAEAAIARAQLDSHGIQSALDGEAMASWFWHLASATGGVRLLVNADDFERAEKVLESRSTIRIGEVDSGDAFEKLDDDDSEIPEDLVRAWRAALIGCCFLPVLLNLYSLWLLLQNSFFGFRDRRVYAACLANAIVLAMAATIILWIVFPSDWHAPTLNGEAPKHDTQHEAFPSW